MSTCTHARACTRAHTRARNGQTATHTSSRSAHIEHQEQTNRQTYKLERVQLRAKRCHGIGRLRSAWQTRKHDRGQTHKHDHAPLELRLCSPFRRLSEYAQLPKTTITPVCRPRINGPHERISAQRSSLCRPRIDGSSCVF